jgi:hypothetical protein
MTTDTPSPTEIEVFLKHSTVKVCSDRNVCNKRTLLEEFNGLLSGQSLKSMFVAITVDYFQDHEWVVHKYGVEQSRTGQFHVGEWCIQIWEVKVSGHNFLVFEVPQGVPMGRKASTMYLIGTMLKHELRCRDNQDALYRGKVNPRQYERLPLTKEEMKHERWQGLNRLCPPRDDDETEDNKGIWTVSLAP